MSISINDSLKAKAIELQARLTRSHNEFRAEAIREMARLCAQQVYATMENTPIPASTRVCIASSALDADDLARGFVSEFEVLWKHAPVEFFCLWTDRIETPIGPIAHIWREYRESVPTKTDSDGLVLIYLELVGEAGCETKYNLMRLYDFLKPSHLHVAAPLMRDEAAEVFNDLFEHEVEVHSLMSESEVLLDGEIDLGGSWPDETDDEFPPLERRLGWRDGVWKRETFPSYVRERRNKRHNLDSTPNDGARPSFGA